MDTIQYWTDELSKIDAELAYYRVQLHLVPMSTAMSNDELISMRDLLHRQTIATHHLRKAVDRKGIRTMRIWKR